MPFHSVRFPARLIGSGEPSHTADVIAGFHWLTFKSNKLSISQVQPTLAHAAPDRGRGRNDRLLGGDRVGMVVDLLVCLDEQLVDGIPDRDAARVVLVITQRVIHHQRVC